MSADPFDYVTLAEAVEITNLSDRTLRDHIADGRLIPAKKLPGATGSYLFRRSDLDALMAARGGRKWVRRPKPGPTTPEPDAAA